MALLEHQKLFPLSLFSLHITIHIFYENIEETHESNA
jgi:hypothetical protein